MPVIFLDANVFFSATRSKTGASNYMFELAKAERVKLVTSEYALKEAKINIEKKLSKGRLPEFYKLVVMLKNVDTTSVTPYEISKYHSVLPLKDIPILTSAINQKVDLLITLDKKDFMSKSMKAQTFPFKINTPGGFLRGTGLA